MSNKSPNSDLGINKPTAACLDLDQQRPDAAPFRRGSLGHVLDIARRLKAEQPIDDEERQLYAEAEAAMQRAFESIKSSFANIAEQIRPVISATLTKLPDLSWQFERWRQEYANQWAPVARQLAEASRQLPPRISSALLALGERGWYLDGGLGMSELWGIEDWLSAGNVEAVEGFLVGHYESRLSEIEDELAKSAPKREKILRSAIAAHRRGEYELSVPVLLAQADGVCVDLTNFHLFIKDRKLGAPEVARWAADASLDAFSAALLSPLTQALPIGASGDERERRMREVEQANWVELNRHLVLHGESVNYGTQVNSLKAISLINYLVSFVSR